MKKVSSLAFFPYDPNSLLLNQQMKRRLLRLSLFFVTQCINSINLFFIKHSYMSFDAHVGDTLCQIRAYKILQMLKQFKETPKFVYHLQELKALNSAKKQIEEKLHFFSTLTEENKGKYNKSLDKHESITEFSCSHGLHFEISETTHFLTKCFILTKFSIRTSLGVSLTIDHRKLMRSLKISQTAAKKLIKNFQVSLAEISSEFIFDLCKKIDGSTQLCKMLSHLEMIDNHKRRVLPTYEATKVILLHMKISKIPILFITHKQLNENITKTCPFLFIYSEEKHEFELHPNINTFLLDTPCFIIHGTTESESIDSIIRPGLIAVVLSNMATHPELIPKNAGVQPTREFELSGMRQMAITEGYCKENPLNFFLKHIYADTLQNELARLKTKRPLLSYPLTA